ncbi:dethiobiotin synthase [Fulvivirga sedimenti]|uniref:ATP-dependent dethiobiotin synthetase BioD n=1 Tax=Fulvivirga sedimenti TaxID=2879465 RepID=A0A9X1HVM6_9BACT|nr:dethiobiotin synthase [Fulvivirga sedimenti]MCA6079104.1 dethiobiotin synthase [Fulvivirga sedimenti]
MITSKQFFVSAIGTDSGKTLISAILARHLNADYWKPIQAGDPRDSEEVARLTGNTLTIHPERYHLKLPASPHLAAKEEGITISLNDFELPSTGNLIVEGAGGLMVPLNDDDLVIDLPLKWNMPIILVCNIYLGSINHSLLSIEYLKNRNANVAGIIFNGPETRSTESIIEQKCPWPVLLRVRKIDNLSGQSIEHYASQVKF